MGAKESLMWLIAMLCCAIPLILIAGGASIFVGVLFQQVILFILGLSLVVLIVLIYARRKKQENQS